MYAVKFVRFLHSALHPFWTWEAKRRPVYYAISYAKSFASLFPCIVVTHASSPRKSQKIDNQSPRRQILDGQGRHYFDGLQRQAAQGA